MPERTWICQRQAAGEKCGAVNPKRRQICQSCGKRRPATKRPAHRAVMDVPREVWIARFGNVCGICGAPPSEDRQLDRDHSHKTGAARGMLCHSCNRRLWSGGDLEWARRVVAYFERAEALDAAEPMALVV